MCFLFVGYQLSFFFLFEILVFFFFAMVFVCVESTEEDSPLRIRVVLFVVCCLCSLGLSLCDVMFCFGAA